MKYWILVLALVYIAPSCSKKDKITIEELSQKEIDKRIGQYIVSRKQECVEKTMKSAISIADSLLKQNAVKYKEDNLERPPLPLKPAKVIKPIPRDSVQNRPFIKSDSLN